MERTEEQKVTQAPLMVKLGGKEYAVAPLVIREARMWRRKVVDVMSSLPEHLGVTTDTPEAFDAALKMLLVDMQDTVIDLFFEYAKDLDRDEIEGIATEEDIEEAFSRVVGVAFPLARSLPLVRQKLFQ